MLFLASFSFVLLTTDVLGVPPAPKLQPAKKVQLTLDDEREVEIDFPSRPAILNDLVNLIPGEKLLIKTQIRGDRLISLNLVETNVSAERTLEIEFKQERDGKRSFMILSVKNPFDRTLVYEAGIQRHGQQKFVKTSSVPVPAHLEAFESWPEPLTRIMLKNFRLQAVKSAPMKK